MNWIGDLGLEFYLAGQKFPNAQMQQESQKVQDLLKGLDRLVAAIKWIPDKRSFDAEQGYFSAIKNPDSEVRLPFLSLVYGGLFQGYSGEQEIREALYEKGLVKKMQD